MRKLLLSSVLILFTCGQVMAVGGIVGSPISGGTSTTLSSGAVTTTEILDNTVANADIKDNTIATGKIADGTIVAADIADNVITSAKLLDGTIAGSKLSATIAIATTGTISGKISVLDNVASPTGAQLYGTWNLVNANISVIPPTAVQGMSMCIQDSGSAHDIIFDVPGTDNVILVGVEGAAGVGITNASGSSAGDILCVVALTSAKWTVTYKVGTWASQ